MFRLLLYGVLIIFVAILVRTTMRMRSDVKKWKDYDEGEEAKKPVLNIPDIQDAKFEDITGSEDDSKGSPTEPTKDPPKGSPPPP